MRATEVMIGDLVKFRCFDNSLIIGQVVEIHTDIVYIKSTFGHHWSNLKDIEPISLTPEILEKNGFTKSTPPPGIHAICYSLENKEEKYLLTIANYNKYKRLLLDVNSEDSDCFNIKCDYVHELQHALKLCGINREIIL